MVRTKVFARIETPEGQYDMSQRECDELRMLLHLRKRLGIVPNAEPPVMESNYDRLLEFLEEHVRDDGYLDGELDMTEVFG